MRKAIVFGASGLVGKELMLELTSRVEFDEVYAVVRKPLNFNHSRLKQVICNFTDYTELNHLWKDADIFCAIGTTMAKTPDKEEYFKIDYGIPVALATQARRGKAHSLHIVSAMGANPKSNIFYNATKGKMEEDVKRFGPDLTILYRPALILGEREERRPTEKAAQKIFKSINKIVPRKYRGITANHIAKSMIYTSLSSESKSLVTSGEMVALADNL